MRAPSAIASDVAIRTRAWQVALATVLIGIVYGFGSVLWDLLDLWTSKADYSHGLLIVPFAGYLLWRRRDRFPVKLVYPDPWGIPFFVVGAGLFLVVERVNIAKETVQAMALLLTLAGTLVMFCGRWKALRWAWPALFIIPFAFPLPHRVEHDLILKLRNLATEGANYVFQTMGFPSYTEGNIIVIGETKLGVEKACSGLSMLLAFQALTAAMALLLDQRPKMDRIIIFLSAIPIALASNLIRIVITGLIYHAGWTELGDLLFHDLFGWAMMPLALGFIWAELRILDWVVEHVERVSTVEALGLPGKPRPGPVR